MKQLAGKDNRGVVFIDGDLIIRKINDEYYNDAISILNVIIDNEYFKGDIVRTIEDPDRRLLIHDKHLISYPHEWTPNMLKDASLFYLNLFRSLDKKEITIKDALPTNILFHNTKPVFIDFNSFIFKNKIDKEKWLINNSQFSDSRFQIILDHFYPYFLIPLLYASVNRNDLRNFLLKGAPHIGSIVPNFSHIDNVEISSFAKCIKYIIKHLLKGSGYSFKELIIPGLRGFVRFIIRGHFRTRFNKKKYYEKRFLIKENRKFFETLEYLKNEIIKLDVKPGHSSYISYYSGKKENFTHEYNETWNEKQKTIYQILVEKKPNKVLDIGANTGWFSFLAEKLGSEVISIDSDIACLENIYHLAKNENLKVTPLMVDFIDIEKEYFLQGDCKDNSNPFYLSPLERLESEMVFCLGLLHHLVLGLGYSFQQIIDILYKLTKNILIVEFVNIEDEKIQGNIEFFPNYYRLPLANYNITLFINQLNQVFSNVELRDSNPNTRKIIVAEK